MIGIGYSTFCPDRDFFVIVLSTMFGKQQASATNLQEGQRRP
jgi:hypothetical protein